MSLLDGNQALAHAFDDSTKSFQMKAISGTLITVPYDSMNISYYSSGSGAGQIQTVQYYQGGLSGTLVATLTLSYNGAGQVSSVVKS